MINKNWPPFTSWLVVFSSLFLFSHHLLSFHLSCSLLLSLLLSSLFLMRSCTTLSSSLLPSECIFNPLQSHNLASVLCHPLPSFSSLKYLQTTTTQLQALLSYQCFSLQLPILFHSKYFPPLFPSWLLFSFLLLSPYFSYSLLVFP